MTAKVDIPVYAKSLTGILRIYYLPISMGWLSVVNKKRGAGNYTNRPIFGTTLVTGIPVPLTGLYVLCAGLMLNNKVLNCKKDFHPLTHNTAGSPDEYSYFSCGHDTID
jgi:hypothetical protein